jgi:hypothetical protein
VRSCWVRFCTCTSCAGSGRHCRVDGLWPLAAR